MAAKLGTVAPIGFNDFADPQWMQCMRELGCQTVQVYRNRNGNDNAHDGPVTRRQMEQYVEASGLPCDSLHGLYGNDLDPSSPAENGRRAAIEAFKAEGYLAQKLGGPLVVVHCSGIYRNGISEDEKACRIEQFRKSIIELGEYGQAEGINYAFENLPPYHAIGSDVIELADLLRDVNLPSVGMCYDAAHANLANDPIKPIEQAGDIMTYMHICDNHGLTDDHLMPFTGQIDWMALAEKAHQAEYNGVLMLETFYKVDELREMIDNGLGDKLAAFLAKANGE